MLKPMRPLAEDIAQNAWSAAFRDPRFSPMSAEEMDGLDIHISILGEPEPMEFSDEKDLVSKIRPGVDGLILEDGFNRGTFLPSVWESLPVARDAHPASAKSPFRRQAGVDRQPSVPTRG